MEYAWGNFRLQILLKERSVLWDNGLKTRRREDSACHSDFAKPI
jgi:hypothetical protein